MRFNTKILERPPRALVLAQREAERLNPRQTLPPRKLEPLMPLYARGILPIDAVGEEHVRQYLDAALKAQSDPEGNGPW